jgi:hypothetical protein
MLEMSPAQQEAMRRDHPSGKMKKTQWKVANLSKDLQAKGVIGMGDKKYLQRICTLNDVPIEMSMQGIAGNC